MSIDPSVIALIGARPVVVGFLLPVVIVALVAYGVFELVRSSATPAVEGASAGTDGATWSPAPTATSAALTILDERFARGEIDAEEYVQRRSLLAPPPPPVAPPVSAPAATPIVEDPTVAEEPTAVEDATDAVSGTDDRDPSPPGT